MHDIDEPRLAALRTNPAAAALIYDGDMLFARDPGSAALRLTPALHAGLVRCAAAGFTQGVIATMPAYWIRAQARDVRLTIAGLDGAELLAPDRSQPWRDEVFRAQAVAVDRLFAARASALSRAGVRIQPRGMTRTLRWDGPGAPAVVQHIGDTAEATGLVCVRASDRMEIGPRVPAKADGVRRLLGGSGDVPGIASGVDVVLWAGDDQGVLRELRRHPFRDVVWVALRDEDEEPVHIRVPDAGGMAALLLQIADGR
jgi:hypothetical protein